MQVFVRRSDLSSSSNEQVPIIAMYDDNVTVDPRAHGDGMAILSLPANAIVSPEATGPLLSDPALPSMSIGGSPMLAKGWRNTYKQAIASQQATQRIDAVFPEYSQRNSTAELTNYIATYGADASKWPTNARTRKAEIDRCWNYVNAVRAKATSMANAALPADPSLDSNWPTVVNPYQPL